MKESLYESFILILSTLAAVAFVAMPVWILWNWLFPPIFSLPSIDIYQAFGLTMFVTLFNGVMSTGLKKSDR